MDKLKSMMTADKSVTVPGQWAADASAIPELKAMGTYSTSETVVGTWIDGKPIYQKVISATTPSQLKTWVELYRDNNIIVIGIVYDMSWRLNASQVRVRLDYNNDMMFIVNTDIHGIRAYVENDAGNCNKPAVISFRYTKLTD